MMGDQMNMFALPETVPPLQAAQKGEATGGTSGGHPTPALILLDGMAMAYRAFFALQRTGMSSPAGLPTGALYGFTMALLKVFETYRPTYLAALFDSREPTFRHALYPAYKGHREAPPEELLMQLDPLFELLEALAIPVIRVPGYEADDLIGSACRSFSGTCRIYIVTPDKDIAQLVGNGVFMLKPGNGQQELELLDADGVMNRFGVPPAAFTDFLTMTGDSSDNIPGARGIGPKTAASLLATYHSVDEIYLHIDQLSARNRKSLEEFRPNLEMVRQLVTIRTDVPLELTLDELGCRAPDPARLMPLLERLGFRSIASRLRALHGTAFDSLSGSGSGAREKLPDTEPDGEQAENAAPALLPPVLTTGYRLVSSLEEVQELVGQLAAAPRLAVDTETSSLDVFEAELAGISLSSEPGSAFFIGFTDGQLDRDAALQVLKPLLEEPSLPKIGQNLKYDLLVLKKYGIELGPTGFDSMLASYLLEPDEAHNLDDLAARHLGCRTTTYDELVGPGRIRKTVFDVAPQQLSDYACQDADLALRLAIHFEQELAGEPRLDYLCRAIEVPLVSVLAAMEFIGVTLDLQHLARTAEAAGSALETLREEIFSEAGITFNIDSPKQLAHILFEVLGLPKGKKTKTGFSTNVEVLEKLAEISPFAARILEYRSLQKLKSTYIEALPAMINPVTGRIHTSFNQVVTATGRLSSSNPNLQNIPVRTTLGKEIRKAFIPSSPDHWLLSADYSQIELRIAAELSGDDKLLEAFRNGEDIHAATARVIFETETVTADMRRKAKEVNFGVLYGIMPFGLARRLNISQQEARAIIATYKEKYPGMFAALEAIVAEGKERGYVETLLGRRRYLPDLRSRNRTVQMAAERAAMNMPVQGTAADIIKIAMILCHQRLLASGMESRMLLQVHDELLFETTGEEKEALGAMVRSAMTEAARLGGLANVAIEVAVGTAKNWLEAH